MLRPVPRGIWSNSSRVDHFDEVPVEVVAPGVVAAPDATVGEATGPVGEPGAAVQARVVEGADRLGARPDDEDRLVADQVLAEVTDVGDLFLPAGHLPHARPQPLEFQRGELGTRVPGAGDDVVLADQDAVEVHVAVSSDHGDRGPCVEPAPGTAMLRGTADRWRGDGQMSPSRG